MLLAAGSPFELVWEDVLGERMQVFKQRAPSLRALVERSMAFGDAEYVVFGAHRITFAEHAGKTKVTWRMIFETATERDNVARYAVGANEENMDRLEAELDALA